MDINYNESIESEFLTFANSLQVFPNNKDYVRLYLDFRDGFAKDVHPEIKTRILDIEKNGYYNDHGIDHIKMVIERVSWILDNIGFTMVRNESDKFYVSPYEIFILLMAIQLHDAGHLIASREEHAKKGKELLSKFDARGQLSSAEKKHIGDIARAHGGKDDPIGKLPIEQHLSHQQIRPQLLAALLRLGDELAEDQTRASNFLLKLNEIEPTSEIFHRYSASLDSLNISGGEIRVTFYIEDDLLVKKFPKNEKGNLIDQYLLDEIYKRTYKTFTEGLYCNRFLPHKARVNSLKVTIILLTRADHDEIKRISFELKESGYPTLSNGDIFTLCDSLKEQGRRIDGEYISSLLLQNFQAS